MSKTLSMFFCQLLLLSQACCQDYSLQVKLIDEQGKPVVGEKVLVSARTDHFHNITEQTDETGGVIARFPGGKRPLYGFFVRGPEDSKKYYPIQEKGIPIKTKEVSYVLRRVTKPVPLFVKRWNEKFEKENFGKWMGYDFIVADWVQPLGQGKHADISMRSGLINKSNEDYEANLEIRVNSSNGGFSEFTATKFLKSNMPYPFHAPKEDYPIKRLLVSKRRKPGQPIQYTLSHPKPKAHFFMFERKVKGETKNYYGLIPFPEVYGAAANFHFGYARENKNKGIDGFNSLYGVYFLNLIPNDTNLEYSGVNLYKEGRKYQHMK